MNLPKILIVDDVRMNRRMLSVIFGSEYDILEAKDGEEALALLGEYCEELALVLLDLHMPKMNGFQVLEEMVTHSWKPQVPVIVVTGSEDLEDELQMYRAGADDILHKPFVPEIVLRKAQNLMELYASRKQLSYELGERTAQLDISKKYDPLTGLMNMQSFLNTADEVLQSLTEEECAEYSFSYGNITNFKYYNSRFGKEQGDSLLQRLADVCRDNPQNILSARFGQDHLVVLSKGRNYRATVEAANADFEREYDALGMKLKVGICPVQKSGKNAYLACELAMEACNSIQGTFQCCCEYDDALDRRLTIKQYVLQNVDEAIRNGWICVYYQPVIRTLTGAVCGMEALARWIDPIYGFLSPADFVSALEEAGQIYKIDQYVIDRVCEMLASNEGSGAVPVSVNLSRMDFLKLDIVDYIEKTTQRHAVARDMLNIEITESATIAEQQLVNRSVDRLHQLGYQVWMDDFGSGYSSLNILKELRFDEIKLDMGFMRNFNENSRKVVSSIVAMAKKMGMATLAEGVETQEQMEFLKSIGCERIQGFLFSPPRPIHEIDALIGTHKWTLENRKERGYFDRIGMLNFETNRTMALTEYDGEQYRILYSNDLFQKEWDSFALGDIERFFQTEQEGQTPFWQKLSSLLRNQTISEKFYEMEYNYRGDTMRLRSRCLSICDERVICELEIMNITRYESIGNGSWYDVLYNLMLNMFDAVFKADLTRNECTEIYRSPFSHYKEDSELNRLSLKEHISFAAQNYIYKDDRNAFRDFWDPSTLSQRVRDSHRGFISCYLRTRISTGAYIWKSHYIINNPGTEQYFYLDKWAPLSQQGFTQDLSHAVHRTDTQSMEALVWSSLVHSKNINIFWKDRNRRFTGANQSFLDTYGFASLDEILGKTDEDMGWHTDNEPFYSDEEEVISRGGRMMNRLGKCIIRGVQHDIMASKEPIYQDGEIVGLWGCFTVLEDIVDEIGQTVSLSVKDPSTGMLSAKAIIPAALDYVEGYHFRGENFAILTLRSPRYKKGVATYGQKVINHVLARMADVIRKYISVRGVCGSIYGGMFVIYLKYSDRSEVEELRARIQEEIADIREVNGFPVTILPETNLFFSDDAKNVDELIQYTMMMSAFCNPEELLEKYRNQEMIRNILDRLPCSIAVFHRSPDGTLTRQYISEYAKVFTGKNDRHDADESEIMHIVHKDDLPWVSKRVAETMRANEGMDEVYRVVSEQGKISWVRHISTAEPQPDGGCNFYAVYTDVTAEKNLEEEQRQIQE
ncbi:MAG: EAL domain-containing protein [Eubacteriales bacterium]|nr:EAL domain-containing protein [Eubacteriales bacterium]